MANLLVIFICLLAGLLLQRNSRLPDSFALSLNNYVIFIALPALVLSEVSRLVLNSQALLPIVMAWVIMTASAVLVWVIAKVMGWSRGVTGALMLTVPLGNTSFLGIPLIEALLGKDAVVYAILYDQFGSFVALNTYGSFIAGYYSGRATSWKNLLGVIVKFPPFVALIVAFALIPFSLPEVCLSALQRISTTLVPVVMVAVGLQWRIRIDPEHIAPIVVGLLVTLFIKPLCALVILHGVGVTNLAAQVVVLEAAMPAMISAGAVALSFQLSPRLASSLIGYSLLLSLVTVWVWRLFI